MDLHGGRLAGSLPRRTRLLLLLGGAVALLAIGFGPSVARASAAAPAKTDVMFIFDTSGSMQGVQQEAQEEIKALIATTEADLPNVEFGVASVEDIPGYENGTVEPEENILGEKVPHSEAEFEKDPEKPWALWQPLTGNQTDVQTAIENLSGAEVRHFGGDGPEAYGRALYETATNERIGWRAGARHEIVLIADNVPHTPNVNEGIPSEFQFTEPFTDGFETWPDTGEELGGKFGIPGTVWKPGESLEFHKDLQRLGAEEKPLAMVDYIHTGFGEVESESFIHYWEYWAADTGGQAVTAEEGSRSLDAKLAEIIKESAEGIPPCPPGYERTPSTPCAPKATTPSTSSSPTPSPAPVKFVPGTAPPVPKRVIVLEDGELEEEDEFDEPGSGDDQGDIQDGSDLSDTFFIPLLDNQAAQVDFPAAQAAKHKSAKCKKGFVKKGKKCVSNAPVLYGRVSFTIPTAGTYKLKIKPSSKVLTALKQGKTLNVKLTLTFVPSGTTAPIIKTRTVSVHLPKPKKHAKKHKK